MSGNLAGRVKDAPFVLAATATPAHTPLELPYLAPQFAQHHDEPLKTWSDLPARLAALGFAVEKGRYGWQCTEDPDARRADLARLQGWLTDAQPSATLHRPAPWGPVSVTGTPLALTPAIVFLSALTIPVETVFDNPSGAPITTTAAPTAG